MLSLEPTYLLTQNKLRRLGLLGFKRCKKGLCGTRTHTCEKVLAWLLLASPTGTQGGEF